MLPSSIIILALFVIVKSARILVVVPTPSISHQVVYRPLIQELIDRDHKVTVLTTDPVYLPGEGPNNLREIDLHDVSYTLWANVVKELVKTDQSNLAKLRVVSRWLTEIFKEQLKDESVMKLVTDKTIKFDLLILQNGVPANLIFTHIFKAPAIFMSTFGPFPGDMNIVGSETHPLLYPTLYHKKIYNLTFWEKTYTLYYDVLYNDLHMKHGANHDRMIKDIFGINAPPLYKLKSNVQMLFLNVHPIWLHNQPVPPNIVYSWGVHKTTEKIIPKELQSYLDSSKHGVIYISFGSIFKTSAIPPTILATILKVFSRLPYDILWKWDADELPGKSENIKISKWVPQSDVLKHPNLKLFITHGGLRSTDEAINAGVPLIGLPQFSDQEYNTEKYQYFKIGIKLDYKSLNIENFETAISTIFTNYNSYKNNIIRLRTLMHDQRMPVLDNVIWRIEYLLRHGGVQHLRAPASNMSWVEYYELEIVSLVLTGLIVLGTVLLVTAYICLLFIWRYIKFKITQTKMYIRRK